MIDYISTVRSIRPIYDNLNDERILPYIDEVLNLYVRPALGLRYKDIEENPDSYKEILEGGYIGCTYISGLKKAVAYLVYSRLIQNNQISVTTYGVDHLSSEYAQDATEKEITYQRNQARAIGEQYLNEVVAYYGDCNKNKNKSKFIIL